MGTGSTREVIMLGDFNSCTDRKTDDQVVSPFGENCTNDNGIHLMDLCKQNDLKITNGLYKHKWIHKYTWKQQTRQLKTIIDLIIKQKTHIQVYDVRVQRGATCGSDHYLLRGRMYIPGRRVQQEETDQ